MFPAYFSGLTDEGTEPPTQRIFKNQRICKNQWGSQSESALG